MITDGLKKQFDDMLPYIKDNFKSLVNDILNRAEKLENSSDINLEELQRIIRDAEKLLAIDKKMKNLFKQMNP